MDRCPAYSPFFPAIGCSAALVFAVLGAAYGTARSSSALFSVGILRPDRLIHNTLAAVMAQALCIYGLVAAVLIAQHLHEHTTLFAAFLLLAAGWTAGLCSLAAGLAIGIIGDAGIRASTQQPRLYVGMVLLLIFSEVLGLYGVVVAILLITNSGTAAPCVE